MFSSNDGLKKIAYRKGEIVFGEGQPGNTAYIVDKGVVSIWKTVDEERVQLATLSEGELFGEMAIIDGSPRMAAAVADEDCVLIQVSQRTIEDKIAASDSFTRALIGILINNLRGVHRVYMRRARSVGDYMNAIDHHTEGFRLYMDKIERQEPELSAEAKTRLKAIGENIHELRLLFAEHKDRRHSVLTDADLMRHPLEK